MWEDTGGSSLLLFCVAQMERVDGRARRSRVGRGRRDWADGPERAVWCVVEERLVDHNSIRAGRERGVDRDILSTRVSGRRAGRARGGFRRTCARRLRYVKLIGSALATALEGREADLRALGGRCQSGHLDLVRRRPRGRREFGLEFGKEAGAQPAGGDAHPRSTVHASRSTRRPPQPPARGPRAIDLPLAAGWRGRPRAVVVGGRWGRRGRPPGCRGSWDVPGWAEGGGRGERAPLDWPRAVGAEDCSPPIHRPQRARWLSSPRPRDESDLAPPPPSPATQAPARRPPTQKRPTRAPAPFSPLTSSAPGRVPPAAHTTSAPPRTRAPTASSDRTLATPRDPQNEPAVRVLPRAATAFLSPLTSARNPSCSILPWASYACLARSPPGSTSSVTPRPRSHDRPQNPSPEQLVIFCFPLPTRPPSPCRPPSECVPSPGSSTTPSPPHPLTCP